jgi:hypothetical protein
VDVADEGHHLDPVEEAGERADTDAEPRWTSLCAPYCKETVRLILNRHSGMAPSIDVVASPSHRNIGWLRRHGQRDKGSGIGFGVLTGVNPRYWFCWAWPICVRAERPGE